MLAGFGKNNLTPDLGIELTGYGYYLERKALSVRDELFVRAVAIEENETRLMLVCHDVLGINKDIVNDVVSALTPLGYGRENIIFVSVHTHTGPSLIYHEGCGEVDNDYVAGFSEKVVCACKSAINDLKEVTGIKSSAEKLLAPVAYNRTLQNGPVDPFVRGVMIERENAMPIALVSYACHGVSLGRATCISADFSSEIHKALEKKGALSIYLNGVCGDIDPIEPREGQTHEENLLYIAQTITEAYLRNLVPCDLHISAGRLSETLSLLPLTKDDVVKTAAHAASKYESEEEPACQVARIWEREMLEKDEIPSREDITCGYGKIGDMGIVALPFEAFTKTGLLIREAIGSEKVMVLGCAEQLLGYLPVKEDIEQEAYAALESAFLYKRVPPAPGEAERLGETIGHLLIKS
ncbi:MAG: hypothetical protein E7322_09260 [Clostridiales bacterium]|nr:hypothetical protein [Clostridiales bacterium]